jgi:MinD-like ATPase involved in chromosome partitioning or flagellar assembly
LTKNILTEVEGIEIVEECSDLEVLKIILEYSDVDVVILDRYLDETENGYKIKTLIKNTRRVKKDVRFIILLGEYEENFVSAMVNLGVFDLVVGEEITTEINELLNNPRIEFDFSKYSNLSTSKGKKIKEKVVYKLPKDYQKIIGIYSPYATGKTVIATNLAKYYVKNRIPVTLIDTDFIKKDLLYYYPLGNKDFFKLVNLYEAIKDNKDINDIKPYTIEIDRLKLFTDHRDSKYQISFEMVNTIVRNSDSNVIIIDISSCLNKELANEILYLCDERVIVADKMISTLNGLPYKLTLKRCNRKNLSLVINKNIEIKSLSNKEILKCFKNIELSEREKYSLDFKDIFFIPNRFKLIVEGLANREEAYGKDPEFDESIEKLAASLYQIGANFKKTGMKEILSKIFRWKGEY